MRRASFPGSPAGPFPPDHAFVQLRQAVWPGGTLLMKAINEERVSDSRRGQRLVASQFVRPRSQLTISDVNVRATLR